MIRSATRRSCCTGCATGCVRARTLGSTPPPGLATGRTTAAITRRPRQALRTRTRAATIQRDGRRGAAAVRADRPWRRIPVRPAGRNPSACGRSSRRALTADASTTPAKPADGCRGRCRPGRGGRGPAGLDAKRLVAGGRGCFGRVERVTLRAVPDLGDPCGTAVRSRSPIRRTAAVLDSTGRHVLLLRATATCGQGRFLFG